MRKNRLNIISFKFEKPKILTGKNLVILPLGFLRILSAWQHDIFEKISVLGLNLGKNSMSMSCLCSIVNNWKGTAPEQLSAKYSSQMNSL